MKKVSLNLRLTGCRKCYFLLFAFSLCPDFSKIWQWILRVLSNFYYVTNIFDLHIFENETAPLLIVLFIVYGYAFRFFIFSKWKNMTVSHLMIHWKCTVVYYTNLNWSSKSKPFLNYGQLNMLFCFFRFLIYFYFNEAFAKIFIK